MFSTPNSGCGARWKPSRVYWTVNWPTKPPLVSPWPAAWRSIWPRCVPPSLSPIVGPLSGRRLCVVRHLVQFVQGDLAVGGGDLVLHGYGDVVRCGVRRGRAGQRGPQGVVAGAGYAEGMLLLGEPDRGGGDLVEDPGDESRAEPEMFQQLLQVGHPVARVAVIERRFAGHGRSFREASYGYNGRFDSRRRPAVRTQGHRAVPFWA